MAMIPQTLKILVKLQVFKVNILSTVLTIAEMMLVRKPSWCNSVL